MEIEPSLQQQPGIMGVSGKVKFNEIRFNFV